MEISVKLRFVCVLLLLVNICSGAFHSEYYTYVLDDDELFTRVNNRPFITLHDSTTRLKRETNIKNNELINIAEGAENIADHVINKRQTNVKTSIATPIDPSGQILNEKPTASPQNVTLQIPMARVPLNRTVTQNATLPLHLNDRLLSRNLGENGTGIRKISTTPVPSVNPTTVTVAPSIKLPLNMSDYEENVELPDVDVGDGNLNQTLRQHNISVVKNDTHMYYNSTFSTVPEEAKLYWVDLESISNARINELLSNSYRRAATVKLTFDFPFYGHLIRNITIATGGFVYTGDYVHSWLAATQYIAPLMANFDTSISNDSYIKHYDNGTAFIVEWHNVALQDKPEEGEFTFQLTLLNTGDIIFVYKNIPTFIEKIRDDQHPVKVGLSDAFIMDQTIFFVRRKTIYEYDRINFAKEDIKNWTVVTLRPLSTCVMYKNCEECVTQNNTAFTCKWCPTNQRCSSGRDRYRQEWLARSCEKTSVSVHSECSAVQASDNFRDDSNFLDNHYSYSQIMREDSSADIAKSVKMGVSGILAIIFIITLISGSVAWIFYAYMNPHTASGQFLIKYRPSQWRWRRGEPRYTVATIHM